MFSDWASQVFRLYKGSRHVEIEYTVGHIPIGDNVGKEIISRYVTSLQTKQTFYTDANGREILKRVRDHRDTWPLTQTEPVSGNYYPVNSRIFIQDTGKDVQLTVLTDRSQGGASIQDGQMELMVHRRLLYDDGYGVGEALNETGLDGKGLYIRGKHYLVLDKIESSAAQHRDLAQRLFMGPLLSLLPSSLDPAAYSKLYRTTWSALKRALPLNVHLLTLEQYRPARFLLRLEHFYARSEDSTLSQPVSVGLKDLFGAFSIGSLEEVTLGANQLLDDATRLQWNVANYGMTGRDLRSYVTPVDPASLTVVLKPMQIRSFLLTLTPSDMH
jgi:lysosomal alpha-mannosidase